MKWCISNLRSLLLAILLAALCPLGTFADDETILADVEMMSSDADEAIIESDEEMILAETEPIIASDAVHYSPDASIDIDDRVNIPDSIRHAGETKYERNVYRFRRYWASLIPTHLIMQNAGNMGWLSIGTGWSHGRKHKWETSVLIGFIPKYKSNRAKMTMTVKETFIPFHIDKKYGWVIEPLSCGLYINTVYGHEFWRSQPGRYPDKYYEMLSTRFRANVFIGQRVTKIVPYNKLKFMKSITLFYEVSSCDLYIRSLFQGTGVNFWDILGLSFGVKTQIF